MFAWSFSNDRVFSEIFKANGAIRLFILNLDVAILSDFKFEFNDSHPPFLLFNGSLPSFLFISLSSGHVPASATQNPLSFANNQR